MITARDPIDPEQQSSVDTQTWFYGEWVDLLGAHFFTADKAGAPVTFFVDDEILADLSGLPPSDAAESLVRSIERLFGRLDRADPYELIVQATTAWERSGSVGYIRCLPLLALAVLAGTRMHEDGVIRKTNYYRRFRALVGMSGAGQPPGYELMPRLWAAFTRWLDETMAGTLGRSTVSDHPTYRYIGAALSQALFRLSDRHELTYFLDYLGIPVTDGLSPHRLMALFRHWSDARGRFSPGARLLINDPAYSAQLDLMIREVASRWDGSVLDELGMRESRVLLHWNIEDGDAVTTLAERPIDFPETVELGDASPRRVLIALHGTHFYREPPFDVDAELLQHGRRIRAGRYSFRMPRAVLHVLAENDEIPGWSSTRRFGWGRPHMVIAEASATSHLAPLLEVGAEPGYSAPRTYASLPTGWVAYRSVIPRTDASALWASSGLGDLLPLESPRAALVNGLRLRRDRVYLAGGEPDLICPADAYELDGRPFKATRGSVVPLRDHGLEVGRHLVTVGDRRMRFATSRGSVGVPSGSERAHLRVSGYDFIAGADAPQSWSRKRWIWRVRTGRQYVAVGSKPGEIARLVRQPQLRSTRGFLWSPWSEVEIAFEPVWVIERDWGGAKTVRLAAAREPDLTAISKSSNVGAWAKVFALPVPDPPELWQRYQDAANLITGSDEAC